MAETTNKVPRLRFPEFDNGWNKKKFSEITSKIGSGITPRGGAEVYTKKGIPFIRSQNVINDNLVLDGVCIPDHINQQMKGSIVKPGDVLLNITGASIGRSCLVPKELEVSNVNQHVCIIRLIEDSPQFVQSFLSSHKGQKLIAKGQVGSGREGLNFQSIGQFRIYCPSLPEQQKIATFLSAVDKKITQLEKKKTLLETYKKGVMQKIFKREPEERGSRTPLKNQNSGEQIRFKDSNGNRYSKWETRSLGSVFSRITDKNKEGNKNVLTISAQLGLINQEEFFNKSVAAKDLSGYYLLQKGDFAYNKSYSKGYPMGATKRLDKYGKGVVSTLYICFRIKNEFSSDFYKHYFDSGKMNHEIHKIAQEGARNHGLLNISVIEFFNDIKIPIPSLEEQQKIASFLTSLDKKIDQVSIQLEKTKTFKKGLLQQMFV